MVYGFDADGMVAIQHNEKIDKMITGFRKTYGFGLIKVGDTNYRQIFKALKNNRFVVIASDQHDPSESLIMDFFGRRTTVARGPALFAIKNNCPIITILNRRIDYDKFEVMISEPIYPPDTGNLDEDVKIMSRAYMDNIEKVIKKYPDQWLWTHKRWKLK
jgi:KDO2-lipid IV(A) lauroyltransferase